MRLHCRTGPDIEACKDKSVDRTVRTSRDLSVRKRAPSILILIISAGKKTDSQLGKSTLDRFFQSLQQLCCRNLRVRANSK